MVKGPRERKKMVYNIGYIEPELMENWNVGQYTME